MRNRLHVAVFPRTLSLIALLAVSACTDGTKDASGPAVDAPGPAPDTLTIGLSIPAVSLNPLTYLFSHERWIIHYTHSCLYILDKASMTVQPELAVGPPEMSSDKLRWTIRLRQDARWHDGEPVTAKDVEASFRMMMDTTVDAGRLRAVYSRLKSVKARDKFTCELTYSEPHSHTLQSLLDFPVLPAHELEELEKPADLNDRKTILGSGPYKLVSLTSESVVLERNDKWFGEKPKLKRIIYKIIQDPKALVSALQRGEIDTMGVPYSQWHRDLSKKPEFVAQFHQLRYHRPSYRFLGWNCSKSLFSDKGTRQALARAFDVQKYLDENFYSGSRRATGPFFFKSPQHDPGVKAFPHDPETAVKLLKTAGWKDSDGDGTLDRNGVEFEFTVIYLAQRAESENLAAALQDSCAKIGIKVVLKGLDNAALGQQLNQGDFDCVAYGYGWSEPELDPYQIFHSDSGANHFRFSNDDADALIEEARMEFDEDRRNALNHRLHRLLYDEQPFMFLLAPEYLLLVNKRFQNVKSYGLGLTPRIGIEWCPVEAKKRPDRQAHHAAE